MAVWFWSSIVWLVAEANLGWLTAALWASVSNSLSLATGQEHSMPMDNVHQHVPVYADNDGDGPFAEPPRSAEHGPEANAQSTNERAKRDRVRRNVEEDAKMAGVGRKPSVPRRQRLMRGPAPQDYNYDDGGTSLSISSSPPTLQYSSSCRECYPKTGIGR